MKKIIGSIIGFMGYIIQVIVKKPSIAISFYGLADKYNNSNNLSLAAYGILLFEEEQYEKSLKQFKKIQNNNKKDYLDRIVSMNMALSYWRLECIDKAIEVLEGLRSRYEYLNGDILTSLGYFYLVKNDYEKALSISNQVLEDEPEHAPALDNIGQIYYKQGEFTKAEEYFLKALKYKDMVDSKYYLGLIYEKWDQQDKAEECFRQAFDTQISRFSTVSKEVLAEKYEEYGILKN